MKGNQRLLKENHDGPKLMFHSLFILILKFLNLVIVKYF